MGVLIEVFALIPCCSLQRQVGARFGFCVHLDVRGIGIPQSDAATAFWNTRARFDQNASCAMPPEGATFLGDRKLGSILYYRQAFGRLHVKITEVERAIVTGTLGSGKTLFGLVLVCQASMRTDGPRTNLVYHVVSYAPQS
jgi:hypothetical protein